MDKRINVKPKIDYFKWAKEYGVRVWQETAPKHWEYGSNHKFWCYQGPWQNKDGIGIGHSGGLSIETWPTENSILKFLYERLQKDIAELKARKKQEKIRYWEW